MIGMPFPGGIDATPNATLLFSIAAALIYAVVLDGGPTLARSAAKTLAVGLLAVLAFVQQGPWLLVTALVLSAVGDAFLSREGDRAFLGGLGSFLAAHVAYVALFLTSGIGLGIVMSEPARAVTAAAMVILGVGMLAVLWRRVGPELKVPVTVYIAAILAMGISALTLDNLWVIGGAVLFMASDTLLASERFLAPAISPHRVWMRYSVWGLYYLAQLAITLGFLLG